MKKIALISTILIIMVIMAILVNNIKIPAPLKLNQHNISIDNFI